MYLKIIYRLGDMTYSKLKFLTFCLLFCQGGEWDYVIFSTARSLPEYRIEKHPTLGWCKQNLGFITDEHQINVALTRARRGLIIIGRSWNHVLCGKKLHVNVIFYKRRTCLKLKKSFHDERFISSFYDFDLIKYCQYYKSPLIFTRKPTPFVLWPGVEETDLSLRSPWMSDGCRAFPATSPRQQKAETTKIPPRESSVRGGFLSRYGPAA